MMQVIKPSLLLRSLKVLPVGTLIWIIFLLAGFEPQSFLEYLLTWLQNIIITFITWAALEGSIHKIDIKFPWRINPKKRIIAQITVVPIVSFFTIGIPLLCISFFLSDSPEVIKGFRIMLVMGILFSLFISTAMSAIDFYKQSLKAAIEIEQLKEENLRSQLETLRQQVNPHFLFNSLNVLSALIPLDPKTALLFVQQLSKVYRYILDAGKESFASVQVEMDSLDAYAFLLKQRFGNAIIWKITSEHNIKGRIPALSLQLLAENAVKHNIVSAAKPLTIQIIAKNDVVKVINNVQEKHISEPSTGTGLNNISQRYLLSGHTPPEIHQSNELFEVILPIIKDTDDTSTNN